MNIDFERDFGVNAGYVQELHEDWKLDPESVEASWRKIFEHSDPRRSSAPPSPREEPAPRSSGAPPQSADSEQDPQADYEVLSGVAGKIVDNMVASLELPTATSVRNLPAKILDENRRLVNEHMRVRALGKASFTHIIAFAIVRALADNPRVQSSFIERGEKPERRIPKHVNLGLAIDVEGPRGRSLVVPNIKGAESMDFAEFYEAYQDLVERGRKGKLSMADFQGTTVTLTNPGGFGTSMSVPRLMNGQGLIVATGSIGVPSELSGSPPSALANLAIGPVMTMTSTYDHRVIQGAESGVFLRRVDQLLQGADGFYEDMFSCLRIPWEPHEAVDGLRDHKVRDHAEMQVSVWKLINAYRVRGCQLADLDPLEYRPDRLESLDPKAYGFSVWDLDRVFLCGDLSNTRDLMPLREILATLRRAYCRRWTLEYMHIADRDRKWWIREHIEDPDEEAQFDTEHRLRILKMLSRAENFERFLHASYVGNKRFSLEGADTLIPALAELIERAASHGVERVIIGMAHRGRLNVLANIMGKSYGQIFGEFEAVLLPLSQEGSGDVKYHLGQRGAYHAADGREVEVVLSANPSHLEAVNPVVCGMVRANQDVIGDVERERVLAVLVHGDAAFSGQGVTAETLNMSELRAYGCGGTVHLVVNNQIGFTASPVDLRSTYYCTDMAKSIQAPIAHVNGDFPESVLRGVMLAVDYQRAFGSDAVVDIVCYRRWGHNEGDEPAFTQPVLYSRIRNHPTVRENYTQLLVRRGTIDRDEAERIGAEHEKELSEALASFRAEEHLEPPAGDVIDCFDDDPADYVVEPSPATGIESEALVEMIDRLNEIPKGHVPHPNLMRQLRRREQMVRGERDLDWGCAEALAFATLLGQGVPIRLAGQDSCRGTFSHRHAVVRDQQTGADHIPLAGVGTSGATFEVRDSLLSEEAALAFEYGYALERPEALVIWEAQFGDFVNGAQIPLDQFVMSGESKWRQRGGLVLLLPHGFDGQGPEHSSARPERFLALCSGGNVTIANCSTSAQFFHLMRRQGLSEPKRPLIVFTPKSLLRSPRAASPVTALAEGGFQELLSDSMDPQGVNRVVLSSGKIFHELDQYREKNGIQGVALLRLEQLYPFPRTRLLEELARYPHAEVVWCQEEPRNMGAWPFILQRFSDLGRTIRYAGRPESPSPATGSYRRHQAEQNRVLERGLGVTQTGEASVCADPRSLG